MTESIPAWRDEHWICRVDGCDFHHVRHGAITQHLIEEHEQLLSEHGKQKLVRKGQDYGEYSDE